MIITTSRKSSGKTVYFAKDLCKSLLNAIYKSRGKKALVEFIDVARYEGFDLILVVTEVGGNPVEIRGVKIFEDEWRYYFTLGIAVKKLRKELTGFKNKFPHLKIDVKDEKIKNIFGGLVINSEDSEYSIKESNGTLSFYIEEKEVGPSFIVKSINYD